jgi:flagellar biosynthesis/type III secretory pathway protein FliH
MKTDRQIIDQLHKALRDLHIVCETGPPDIYEWYSAGMFAPAAREKALEALKSSYDHSDAEPPAEEANETIAEARAEGYACGNEDGACWSASLNETIESLKAENAALKADAEQSAFTDDRAIADAWAAGYYYKHTNP